MNNDETINYYKKMFSTYTKKQLVDIMIFMLLTSAGKQQNITNNGNFVFCYAEEQKIDVTNN